MASKEYGSKDPPSIRGPFSTLHRHSGKAIEGRLWGQQLPNVGRRLLSVQRRNRLLAGSRSTGKARPKESFELEPAGDPRGSRWPAAASPLRAVDLLDDKGRFEGYRSGHVVEVGRGRHQRFVDLGELLLGAVPLDEDDVVKLLIARRYCRIDAEEAAEIAFAGR